MKRLYVFFMLFFIWIALTWQTAALDLILGALASLIIAAMLGDVFLDEAPCFKKLGNFILFLPVFLLELLKSNARFALRVTRPVLKIDPGIMKIKTGLAEKNGLPLLANSLTLAKEALFIDFIDGYMYLHLLDVGSKDARQIKKELSDRFESMIRGRI